MRGIDSQQADRFAAGPIRGHAAVTIRLEEPNRTTAATTPNNPRYGKHTLGMIRIPHDVETFKIAHKGFHRVFRVR